MAQNVLISFVLYLTEQKVFIFFNIYKCFVFFCFATFQTKKCFLILKYFVFFFALYKTKNMFFFIFTDVLFSFVLLLTKTNKQKNFFFSKNIYKYVLFSFVCTLQIKLSFWKIFINIYALFSFVWFKPCEEKNITLNSSSSLTLARNDVIHLLKMVSWKYPLVLLPLRRFILYKQCKKKEPFPQAS